MGENKESNILLTTIFICLIISSIANFFIPSWPKGVANVYVVVVLAWLDLRLAIAVLEKRVKGSYVLKNRSKWGNRWQ